MNNNKNKGNTKTINKGKEQVNNKVMNSIITWLLVFLIAIVPLIVYLKIIPIEGTTYGYNTGKTESYDFFSYYKMLWIIIATSLMIIIFTFKNYKNKLSLKKTKMYVPICIYVIFVVLSTLLSSSKGTALFGYIERYEGMLILLAYMAMLFVTINCINDERNIKLIFKSLFVSTTTISIIGIFQYFGLDLFFTEIGKKLILAGQYDNLSSYLKLNFDSGIFYSTLYHYNYVGSYMAMLFPMTLILLLFAKGKNQKLIMGLLTLLTFASLLMSRSRAGIIGTVIALFMIIIMLRKYIIKKWPYYLAGLIAAIIVFVGINIASNGSIVKRLGSMVRDIEGITTDNEVNKLKDIVINGGKVSVITSDNTLHMVFANGDISYTDINNENIVVTYDESNGEMTFKDERYKNYILHLIYDNNTPIIQIENKSIIGGNKLHFAITTSGFKYVTHNGDLVDLEPVERFGFEGKENIGSARGYIWSRSIPLLKDTLILGKGPDTFADSFPQNDYIGKLIAYRTPSMFVDKPHNLFLQTGINTGVISLIAMLAMFILYIAECLKIYMKCDFDNTYKIAGAAIFVSVCGYLGAAFFNDSVVAVAPVFWILLGVGISINLKLKDEKQE